MAAPWLDFNNLITVERGLSRDFKNGLSGWNRLSGLRVSKTVAFFVFVGIA